LGGARRAGAGLGLAASSILRRQLATQVAPDADADAEPDLIFDLTRTDGERPLSGGSVELDDEPTKLFLD